MAIDKNIRRIQPEDVQVIQACLQQYDEMETDTWFALVQSACEPYLSPLLSMWRDVQLLTYQICKLSYLVLYVQMQEEQLLMDIEEVHWWNYIEQFSDLLNVSKSHMFRNAFVRSLYHAGYLSRLDRLTGFRFQVFAKQIFDDTKWQQARTLLHEALTGIGYVNMEISKSFDTVLAIVLLVHRTADLQQIDPQILATIYRDNQVVSRSRHYQRMALALHTLGYGNYSEIYQYTPTASSSSDLKKDIATDWVKMAERWFQTSVLTRGTRQRIYRTVLQAGRWLFAQHPDVQHPEHWTREIALDYVKMVCNLRCYQWTSQSHKMGKDLKASSKQKILDALRMYFTDLQNWQWIPRHFNPLRTLATPSHILNTVYPQPRVIQPDVWAKLLSAAMQLTQVDLRAYLHRKGMNQPLFHAYPIQMVRAVAITWLFSGLRQNEIMRLRIGCIRWQTPPSETNTDVNRICLLHYPANKTGPASLKPVDGIVGEAIEIWQTLRPQQASVLDTKSREFADYLFMYRGRGLGTSYINKTLIHLLCHKAGIPESDSRGSITSHRARSTIATQLANAEHGMSLTDIQKWLGHQSPESTQYYLETSRQSLTQAYLDAGYFERNLRSIRVLMDQGGIRTGNPMIENRWIYYDLGHGYCSYSFFQRCPHRMVCKQCSYYLPKDSHLAQMLEARDHLMEAYQTIELTEGEQEAVTTDLERLQAWIDKLQSMPTPDTTTSGFVAIDDIT